MSKVVEEYLLLVVNKQLFNVIILVIGMLINIINKRLLRKLFFVFKVIN